MYFTLLLIIFTCVISYKGIKDELFLDRYSFRPQKLTLNKEYYRLVTSGFLHVSWTHLVINMIVLFAFGSGLETRLGVIPFLVIYFASMTGANLFALWIHKYHTGYNSVGASGAISGLVFSTIAISPLAPMIFGIPMWVVGLLYIVITVYAIRSQKRDVGHAAHLGGALIGMAAALLMFPWLLKENWLPVLAIALPAIALIVIMIRKPELILIDKGIQRKQFTVDDRYNLTKAQQKKDLDRILEKISEKGMDSLTRKEKELLKEYSKS